MDIPGRLRRIGARLRFRLGLTNPFASVWDAPSRERLEQLVNRIGACAAVLDLEPILFWGTLLGHVREGDVLPWDDDVDLALFDVAPETVEALLLACRQQGLATLAHDPGEKIIKIFDPHNPAIQGHEWTWPFVDLFLYTSSAQPSGWQEQSPVPLGLVLPGRATAFAGTALFEPHDPCGVLDRLYPTWRSEERSSSWNHRLEQEVAYPQSRRIRTDGAGRKRVPRRPTG